MQGQFLYISYSVSFFMWGHKDCSLNADPMGKHLGNPPSKHLNTAAILMLEFVCCANLVNYSNHHPNDGLKT